MNTSMFAKTSPNSEKSFIVECIRYYRDLPCLWNMKIKDYHDRKKKNMAYELLINKFRERYPDASKDDVKRKLNSLRTCYRKELRKHLQSLKAGHEAFIYKPTLYYYNEMRFLEEQESTTDSHSEINSKYGTMDMEENEKGYIESTTSVADTVRHSSSYGDQKKKAVKLQRLEELMDLACKHLREKSDDYKHWALACAADLKKMNPTQQVYAKKAIADILMEGQLGLLHRNSVKINEIAEVDMPDGSENLYEGEITLKQSSSPSPSYIDESLKED